MRKVFTLIFLAYSISCCAQQNLQHIRTRSWQSFVYSITAADAEQFMKWDSIPLNRFLNVPPIRFFDAVNFNEDSLALGQYVLLTVIDNNISASLVCVSNLMAIDINNGRNLHIDVRTKQGVFISNAKVFVNNRPAVYNNESGTFWIKQLRLDKAVVKIYTTTDTLFTALKATDIEALPVSKQIRRNYHSTKIYKILNWLPSRIRRIPSPNDYRYKKPSSNRIGAKGYMIFNQPKYKLTDTVKFKGYVVDKKGRQYKKPVEAYLRYYNKGKYQLQKFATIPPVTAGAFVGQILLADSMPLDTRYELVFNNKSGKEVIRNYFSTEDYVLDEIGSYVFYADKETYFRNDTLLFAASAKDANGLNVLDVKARLQLIITNINKTYQDTLFVADTVYNEEIKMLTDGDTKFKISTGILPKADVIVRATLYFKNSNNELQEETQDITYKYFSKEIIVKQQADSIYADYVENGKISSGKGELQTDNEKARQIHFPFSAKIDPVASEYNFAAYQVDKKEWLFESFSINDNYKIRFTRISRGDTLGFILYNPYEIPIYFTVFNGKQVIASGKQSSGEIGWKKIMSDHRQSYKVRWQYIWAGEEKKGEENIGLLYKLLNIKIHTNESVFPGQKDSVKIEVKDYRGKAAANVNLTAVSYNNQFKKDINVPEPPYIAKYKGRHYILRQDYENDIIPELSKNYLLGNYPEWKEKFHLDSMPFYKLLFPKDHYHDEVTLIENILPQVSVNVVRKGVPQEIYLLYLDRNLRYYNGVTDRMKYAYEVYPGIVQIGIRLPDRYIEIDSIYIQPNYKHDLSFDLDDLPPHTTTTIVNNYWSTTEMNLIESTMWMMQDNSGNNNAFLWQGSSLVQLHDNKEHIAGPFRQYGEMIFFSPGIFDIAFKFESHYQYNLSKQVLRLEKKNIFPRDIEKNFLPKFNKTVLKLGDTILPAPIIYYPAVTRKPFIKLSKFQDKYIYQYERQGMGKLLFTVNKDSMLDYIILKSADPYREPLVVNGYNRLFKNIEPGIYTLLLVTNNFYTSEIKNIVIKEAGTEVVITDSVAFIKDHSLIRQLMDEAEKSIKKDPEPTFTSKEPETQYLPADSLVYTRSNVRLLTGTIRDNTGKHPIPFASVYIKGTRIGVTADVNGEFSIRAIRPGRYTLLFASINYLSKEVVVDVNGAAGIKLDVALELKQNTIKEVIVTSAFETKRSLRSQSSNVQIVSAESLTAENALAGKVAGAQVRSQSEVALGRETIVRLRGENGFGGYGPIYIIDGIIYKELPKNFNPGNVSSTTVLQGADATALYGSDAVNGAIVITTKIKNLRKDFKDYAIWQPNFFTDENGRASFEVVYPDNITGWKTYVVGMDKKRRIGKASVLTQSYKPISAQLSVPQFLTEGDSAIIIGKAMNYTDDRYQVSSSFSVNGNSIASKNIQLLPRDANIAEQYIYANNTDTISASFLLTSTTGFRDTEEKTIPVVKKGIEEAIGNFWVLQNDTTINIPIDPTAGELNFYAQNNTLDVYLEELEHLESYPYSCMEQTASKLLGIAMEKKIKAQLKLPFKNQKIFDKLLDKVQKSQLFEGGWAWWENGHSNLYVTTYITAALLQLKEDPLVQTNIRNAFLYLQNQVPYLDRNKLLTVLATLSGGAHAMNYGQWLDKLKFDSLTQHQQWLLVKIKQEQKMDYAADLKKLVSNQTATMLGGVHWGNEGYYWYGNEIATTVLAFNVLKNEPAYTYLLPQIIQYFLEKRQTGHWRNTVETASILDATLPFILAQQADFTKPAQLNITGDTSFAITSFPYKLRMNVKDKGFKQLSYTKSGGGLVYFTAYQKIFNIKPTAVNDKFVIRTSFQKNGQTVSAIRAGEKIKMIIEVNVLKDAEFVMLQVPILAGCIYANKNNNDWRTYKEFYKNKLMIFAEIMPTGMHTYEIELEPRYKGSYVLNPAKAALMYFPTFYGRNGMGKVAIVN